MYILQKLRNLKEYLSRGGVSRVEQVRISVGQELKGRRIVVTGGSSGIGLAIAKRLAEEGAAVVVTGRDTSRLSKALDEIGREKVFALTWDIGETNKAPEYLSMCEELLAGPVDALVNNAGVSKRETAQTLTHDAWMQVLDVDLSGSVFLGKAFCDRWMQIKHQGVLVNMASTAGLRSVVDAYGVSKASLIHLTSGWAKEYARYGIRINAIAPGVVVGTNMNALQQSVSADGNLYCAPYPAKRFGVPSEIAEVALFLVSDRSSYIYGQTIVVDGGATL